MLVCGPSFGSGRYGYACGLLAREAAQARHPGGLRHGSREPGGRRGRGRRLRRSDELERRGDARGASDDRGARPPARSRRGARAADEEGYLPRGLRRNERAGVTGAARAVECSCSKLGGETRTEVAAAFDHVAPPPPVATMAEAKLALVTEAGCVPQGNPDGLPTIRAAAWLRYPIGDAASLEQGRYESVHGGFDVTAANRDPNRLVPLDVVAHPRAGRPDRRPPRRLLHDDRQRHPGGRVDEVRAGDRRGAEGGRGRGGDPVGHLRDRHALRGNAGQGDRAGGDPDGVRHRAPDDRDDDRREPRHSWGRDHEPLRRSGTQPGRRARAADGDRRAGARDARDGRRAGHRLGGGAMTAPGGGAR